MAVSVNRIKDQTEAQISITEANGVSNIRIEGNKQGVDQAKQVGESDLCEGFKF